MSIRITVTVESGVEILAQVRGNIVAAKYKKQTAISFHPELNDDMRLYEWWLNG